MSEHKADVGGDDAKELDSLETLSIPSFSFGQPLFRGFSAADGSLDSMAPAAFMSFQDNFSYEHTAPSGGLFQQEVYRSVDVAAYQEADSDSFDFGGGGYGVEKQQAFAAPTFSLNSKHSQSPFESGLDSSADTTVIPRSKAAEVFERVEPPTVPGNYLEPSYHFYTVAAPLVLLQNVLSILQASQVDCSIKRDKFKIKSVAYRSGARVPFSVRVFSVGDSSGKRYAVEFQRRSGDVIFFNELYRSVKRALASKSLIEKVSKSQSTSLQSSLPLPPVQPDFPSCLPLETQATSEQNKEAVKCLVQMAASKCVDVKAQAMLALADLSAPASKAQDALISEGALDTFIDELQCKFEDVHRCAVTGLANLTRDKEEVCQRVRDSGALQILLTLARSPTSQVVRETARALSNIGSALGTKVLDDDRFKATLCNLRCSSDPRARENVSQLLDALHM